ncbi:MAG: zeta toxin family protein [Defluviitaleaceae bacterium]|nr:zeta toxin family protein [Defluviitaleaceae bacterium]
MDDEIYTLFAGVDGAGKSTFYYMLNEDFGHRVNFDEIIRDNFNQDWRNPAVLQEAGKITVRLLRNLINGDQSFNQETTLTGKTIIANIKKAKEKGFKIHLYYVGLENVELSIKRVTQRVERHNGHGVPVEDLQRRFNNSFNNLSLVLPLCDIVRIYDNSVDFPHGFMRLILHSENGKLRFWNDSAPDNLRYTLEKYLGGL